MSYLNDIIKSNYFILVLQLVFSNDLNVFRENLLPKKASTCCPIGFDHIDKDDPLDRTGMLGVVAPIDLSKKLYVTESTVLFSFDTMLFRAGIT